MAANDIHLRVRERLPAPGDLHGCESVTDLKNRIDRYLLCKPPVTWQLIEDLFRKKEVKTMLDCWVFDKGCCSRVFVIEPLETRFQQILQAVEDACRHYPEPQEARFIRRMNLDELREVMSKRLELDRSTSH